MTTKFKDYFSDKSAQYNVYRPTYPKALFSYLSSITASHKLAWDCATGSGQSAIALSTYFDKVIATDASKNQINNAIKNSRITYKVEKAEKTSIENNSIDLITVAQALHWFDIDNFSHEATRVLKTNGVLAVWAYGLLNINSDLNRVINYLYHTTLESYWPPERKIMENGYKDVVLPFQKLSPPSFQMTLNWELSQLIGYLHTWSAVKKYETKEGINPVASLDEEISDLWGNPKRKISVQWPLTLKVWLKTDNK